MLELSPRASVRVDTRNSDGQWTHQYRWEKPWKRGQIPAGPWAVVLTDEDHRYRWLTFDLDSKRGAVGPDLATLLRWLEAAGLTYVIAASGSQGGRHVWVTCDSPLDSTLVHAIHDLASRRLPTLDRSVLANPATGAVRPLGAPHRNGGRSKLVAPQSPARAAALLTPATCSNPSEAFVRLATVMGGDAPAPLSGPRLRLVRAVAGEPAVGVIDDELGPRLPGTIRPVLDAATMKLLTSRPDPDRVSETLISLLDRLALRRWTWPMVQHLTREARHRRGGLLHAYTRPGRGELRLAVTDEEALRRLHRQWSRAVKFAAAQPTSTSSAEFAERIDAVVADVAAWQAAADACPDRWAGDAGPADRAAFDVLCVQALESGETVLSLDVRRAAVATGHGRSTMGRALADRLTPDGWLARREDETGPAAVYELLPITPDHPASQAVAQGGTQDIPPPPATRAGLLSLLNTRLAAGAHDLFAYGRRSPLGGSSGGLGHHAARTYQQLLQHADRALSVTELVQLTGYTARTVTRHLRRFRELLVANRAVTWVHHECPACQAAPGERCRTAAGATFRRCGVDQHTARRTLADSRAATPYWRLRPGALDQAARIVGSWGVTASRARLYAAETDRWHWWQRELEWLRSPKKGIRTGPRVHHDQDELVITTLPAQPRRQYPRTPDGRPDHAVALHRTTLRRNALR